MKCLKVIPVVLIFLSGCASMEAGPDGVVQDTRSDSDLQMVRNPASCLVIKLIETVVANDIQGFRANYRWAGFEAGDDFSRLQHMLLISTMPFTLRMDPPIYEFSGRGEPDLARIKARLACNEVQESYPDGFAVREVRAIRLDSIEDKCTVELFYDGKKYQVSRFVWAAGGPQ